MSEFDPLHLIKVLKRHISKVFHAIQEPAGSQWAWPEEVSYVHALNWLKNVGAHASLKNLQHMVPLSIFHWNEWGAI